MNRKNCYKDLSKWRKTVRKQKNRYYRKTTYAENHKKPWTRKEINMVMEHKITDTELSSLIGRSVGAIQKMRFTQKNR